ncbi:MAG TPA: D-hexose-6-phosphate mutarotase [Verrucomicrobiae bacterium]|nr:D-hexose-6-phosphate mutarotase [Verrucomicrobiae bacterium]
MIADKTSALERRLEIPGRVSFMDGSGELPMLEIKTEWSTAEIYLHGAHVTRFQKRDEPPLLFLSQVSRFDKEHPIRGGIPVIFPWFGARAGKPAHGFARTTAWELKEITSSANGSISLRLRLPDGPAAAGFPPFTADYIVTVSETLELQLLIANASPDKEFTFEECLHTYFTVGDIGAASIVGLKGVGYEDKVENFAKKVETNEAINIPSEVDRVYFDTTGPVEIQDRSLQRKIRVEKEGSASTVVWNPWIAKAQQMSDFGNEEYQKMVCVESGNVGKNKVTLPPGKSSALTVKLSSAPFK